MMQWVQEHQGDLHMCLKPKTAENNNVNVHMATRTEGQRLELSAHVKMVLVYAVQVMW